MGKQISIIIPTYNMEGYIGKCLDSLLIPEFDQVEVLVVNDGSKDRSSEIAHSYANRYPNSIRVIDKPNGNYGSCINAALPQCTGRYVKVLDADDSFDSSAFSKFVRALPFCNEDTLVTSFIKMTEDENELEYNTLSAYKISIDCSYNLEEIVSGDFFGYIPMHRIAYSNEIFKRFSYWQSEGISYTDVQWSIVPMSFCKTIRFLDLPIYRYLIGRDGQTMDPKQRAKSFDNLFKVAEGLIYYCNLKEQGCLFAYLINQTVNFHKSIYFETVGSALPGAMSMLRKYDDKLSIMSPYIFKAIGQINYDKYSSFKVFKDIRDKNYPSDYKIPFIEALKLSVKVKLHRFFNK